MKIFFRLVGHALTMSLLLGGCYTAKPVSAPPQPPERTTAKLEEIQRDTERDMVILFESLLQLDGQHGLEITGDQAKEMLPFVKRNSSEGELTQSDRQRIVIILTAEQKKFVAEYRDHITSKIVVFKENMERDELSPEERERMVREFQAKRRMEHDPGATSMGVSDEAAEPDCYMEMGPDAAQKAVLNVEQRLIRMLEAKAFR